MLNILVILVVVSKAQILKDLQQQLLSLSGYKAACSNHPGPSLGAINHAFPNHRFPTGAIHELMANTIEDHVASAGFTTAIISLLKSQNPVCWISPERLIFPAAFSDFGLDISNIIFLQVKASKKRLSALEEVLRCQYITAVVADVDDLSFTESRRLQLAVEQSGVTGFLLRTAAKNYSTAAIARWKISSLPSENIDEIPGVGFSKWKVQLLRVRNGQPGSWDVVWKDNKLQTNMPHIIPVQWQHKKVV